MGSIKSPGAVAALGASVTDQLGGGSSGTLIANSKFRKLRSAEAIGARDRAVTADSRAGAQWRPALVPRRPAAARTPEQQRADLLAAQQFHLITKFVAACRRQWPGAVIVLRPDGAPERPAIFCRAACAHADAEVVQVQSGATEPNENEEPTNKQTMNEVADEIET